MTTIERRRTSPFAEMLSWLDDTDFKGLTLNQQIRVEDYVEDGTYVLRADLPGIDPEKDLDVHVEGTRLVVKGERREEQHDKNRREMHYGAFARSLPLPADVNVKDITAQYGDGVLEVRFPLGEAQEQARRIPVARKEG
ncbi:MAG: Hsp20/alpha crystallin family protein [Nocardioides sp.]